MWRNLVYQQNLPHDCATESLWNKTAFWFAPWGCLMPMAWREANMMTCLLLPTSSSTADLCWEVLPIKGQIILFFFSIFSDVSLGTCSSCVIHQCVFASPLTWPSCTAWQERKVFGHGDCCSAGSNRLHCCLAYDGLMYLLWPSACDSGSTQKAVTQYHFFCSFLRVT